ncbi:MAG: outer membrane beta-barrel domain-containing protein [Kofleriaceae bacterium]|nr:outer membrane beta-barrel domain-containing protein [Planctomycetota bacterium]MCA9680412.1 outer membrane beta-barrel domain-containing protein [Myxococcales bacterium]MCB9573228.1 outer membrane beta-barrel domain-containing protein [Kofleriaceae bacterium]
MPQSRPRLPALTLATSTLVSVVAVAVVTPAVAHGEPLPSETPLPSCLDKTIKDELGRELHPRGVQKRPFTKDGRLELIARGGLYGGDLTSSAWIAGGALALWLTEDFAIQVGVDVTPIALDLDKPLADFFGDDRFEPGMGYLGLASALWSPIHAKVKIGGSIVHADIMVEAGAGRLFHDSVQGVTFDGGLILDLFTSHWVTFRFETRDVMAVQEAVGETRYTNNLVTTAGIALWLPTPL